MKLDPVHRYRRRFVAVIEYIEAHLEHELGGEELATIAAFSKFHFHRQFQSLFGMGVQRYVQLSRLKRASYQLAFRNRSVLEAALSNGYESPESFARAFRRLFLQTPSAFRERPDWSSWAMSLHPLTSLKEHHVVSSLGQIDIVHFPNTKIALLEHRGSPMVIGDSIRKFIEWRKQHRLHPSVSATFNLLYDDPDAVAPEKFRLGLAAAIETVVEPNAHGIVSSEIPSGRCAKVTITGSDTALAKSIRQLYSEWLPNSDEEPRDFPLFVQRVKFYPDIPEHEAINVIYLPIK